MQWVLRIDEDIQISALNKDRLNNKEDLRNAKRGEDEFDSLGRLKPNAKPAPAWPAQVTPWWVDRIDADLIWSWTTAWAWIKVWVLDTWIELDHPDLKANIKWWFNFIVPTRSATDDNGHWTHVAWTIAAISNTVWVIWVAPKVSLYALKALDANWNGYLSDIIEWLDYAITNWIQIVNMSLWTTSNILSFRDAIIRANQAWIVIVAAAWNDGWAVNYPAAYPEVIAVSATDKADSITYWSSRWAEVDLSAPWTEILSTYKWKTYATLQWTSMATPHVAWAAALVLWSSVWTYDLNTDGKWNPIEVQNKLEATAEDLWVSWKDWFYWAGLVDAEKAAR